MGRIQLGTTLPKAHPPGPPMHVLGHVCDVHVPQLDPQVVVLIQQHGLCTGLTQPGGLIPAGVRRHRALPEDRDPGWL